MQAKPIFDVKQDNAMFEYMKFSAVGILMMNMHIYYYISYYV